MIDVEQFYNSFKDEYTASIRKANPCYDEMLEALLGYLTVPLTRKAILELGCGTGNLTLLLRERFPEAQLVATDISEGVLEVCQKRLGSPAVDLRVMDMRTATFARESFDLVISSLALHHLTDPERRTLYKSVSGWLRGNGRFTFCDRFSDESEEIRQINRQHWKEGAFKRGTTDEEWEKWLRHEAEHDHPGSLILQAIWLKEDGGFAVSEIVWRKYLWGVIYAQKA